MRLFYILTIFNLVISYYIGNKMGYIRGYVHGHNIDREMRVVDEERCCYIVAAIAISFSIGHYRGYIRGLKDGIDMAKELWVFFG